MSNLISRQQAIDEFYKYPNINWTTLDVMEKINSLPSAQPEVVRCKDCKYGILDNNFPHQRFCKFKGDEWNNDDYFCGHAKKREVTT